MPTARSFTNLLDGHTVAVDAETGKEIWRTEVANPNIGETLTMAPLIVKNHVFVGNAGGELGVRGKTVALDLATGKEVWRAYHTGPDKDVLIGPDFKPFYAKDRGEDLGVKYLDRRPMEDGRRHAMGLDYLRSRIESHLLRHRQSRRMECGSAARGQQVVMHRMGSRSRTPAGANGPIRSLRTTPGITTKSWRTSWST